MLNRGEHYSYIIICIFVNKYIEYNIKSIIIRIIAHVKLSIDSKLLFDKMKYNLGQIIIRYY
jgi:hypothetical protein